MDESQIIAWLLAGDVSIQYQVHRDLLETARPDLQARIATEGWGKRFLSGRKPDGHWGERFYQPKWTSTHYTLLDLRQLNLPPDHQLVRESIDQVLATHKAADGGIRLGPSTTQRSDVCVNGMFLNYAAYFQSEEKQLHSIVDAILHETMPDGGFNCRSTRGGARHSSLHSTISVLEGFQTFLQCGYNHRREAVKRAQASAEAFILLHRLFLSDHTGAIIHRDFLKIPYPCRWKYDILRALDYFQYAGVAWDERMQAAMDVLLKKRNMNGSWNVQAAHPGQVHFTMEKAGKPSRWNTLRTMRVLRHFADQYCPSDGGKIID